MPDKTSTGNKAVSPHNSKRLFFALSILDVGTVLCLITAILWLIWRRTPQVPFLDEFATVDLFALRDSGALSFTAFWEEHNGHRILLPKVIDFVLITLTGYNRQVEMTVNLAFAISSAAMLAKCVHLTLRKPFITLALIPAIGGLFLSVAQYEIWMTPFAINFPATVFGVALSAWALCVRPEDTLSFILALVGAVISMLSSFAGLAAPIVFLPYLWLSRYRQPRYLGAWVAIALAITVLYFHDYSLPAAENSTITRSDFFLTCLGAPVATTGQFAKPPATTAAFISGIAGLALLCVNAITLCLLKEDRKTLAFWISVALFGDVSVALVSMGRGHEIQVALTPRYQMYAALWWLPTFVLTTLTISRLATRFLQAPPGPRRLATAALTMINIVALATASGGLIRANVSGFHEGSAWQEELIENQDCVRYYAIASEACLWKFNPHVEDVRGAAGVLERHHFCIFSKPEPAVMSGGNPPLFEIERAGLTFITGQRHRIVRHARGEPLDVWGWAIDPSMRSPVERVIITVDGMDAALAQYGKERPDIASAYRRPELLYCGFHAVVEASRLQPGWHDLGVRIDLTDPESSFRSIRAIRLQTGNATTLSTLVSNQTSALYNIDILRGRQVYSLPKDIRITVSTPLKFEGWAVDRLRQKPAGGVLVLIDHRREIQGNCGLKRPDVASYFRMPDYYYSGFAVVIPPADLPRGRHVVTLAILASDLKTYYEPVEYNVSVDAP